MTRADLHETVKDTLREARVDKQSRMISGAKICGRHSENGRIYLRPCFKESRDLYDGAVLRVEHTKKGQAIRLDEAIGVVRKPRPKQSGLYGDMDIFPGALGDRILHMAESVPDALGASHEAAGQVQRTRDGNDKVRKITEVHGVALTLNPATSSGLFENETSAAKLIESLTATREDPDLATVRSRLFSEYSAPPPREILEEVEESSPEGDEADLAEVKNRLFT